MAIGYCSRQTGPYRYAVLYLVSKPVQPNHVQIWQKWALSEPDHAIFKLAIATERAMTVIFAGLPAPVLQPNGHCYHNRHMVTIQSCGTYRTASNGLIGAHSFLFRWLSECR